MNSTRTVLKKVVYRLFGKGAYKTAYARGKIQDIKNNRLNEPELQFLPHFIQPESVVLDIGANYGHYTVEMARLANKGMVHAFEPIPFTFDVLETITSHFNLANVSLYHMAVSNEEGSIEMTLPKLNFGAPNTGIAHVSYANDPDQASERFEVKTQLIDRLNITGKVDFIKMDIEGHEPQAFKGMEKLIKENRPVFLLEFSHNCLTRSGFDPNEFAHYIKDHLQYNFAEIKNGKPKINSDTNVQDGYYFLIPAESNLKELISGS